MIEADTRHCHHGRREYTHAGVRDCSETSVVGAFDPAAVLPKEGGASSRYARLSCPVDFAINIGCAQTS
jgi:hypothetical protein